MALSSLFKLLSSFILRDLLNNKTRTILTLLGIMLGVAILLAIRLANTSAIYHFEDSINRVSGKTNLQIASSSGPFFDETILNKLHWLWDDFVKITPIIEHPAVIGLKDKNEGVQLLGVDMLADTEVRDYQWTEENKPKDWFKIFEPKQVFIGERLASQYQLKREDTFPLMVNDQLLEVTIAGILSSDGLGGAFGGSLVLMDISSAQQLLNLTGKLSRFDLVIPKNNYEKIQRKLSNQLNTGLSVERPSRRSQQIEKMLSAYQYNLTVLSFIALLVGAFLIYNTMSITVIRRRHEIGTLRAIGLSRKMVILLFLSEAFCLGLTGTLAGLGLGLILANGSLKAISTTVEALYVGQPVTNLTIAPIELVIAFCFGIAVTLLGALVPVVEAASIPAAEATRKASYESKIKGLLFPLFLIGIGLLSVGIFSSFQPPIKGLPVFGFVSAFSTVLGFSFIMPLFLNASFHLLKPLFKGLFQTEGKLALLNLGGSLGRTSVAIASLMTGIAMMVSLAVMIGSFRETVVTWVDQSFQADLWIEPITRGSGRQVVRLSNTVIESIETLPGIDALDRFYQFPVEVNGKLTNLAVGEFDIFKRYGKLKFLDGESTEQVMNRAINNRGVIVTEAFQTKFNLGKNDTFKLSTPTGEITLPIEGVYYDYTSERGNIVMSRNLYTKTFQDDSITGIAIYLNKNTSIKDTRSKLLDVLPEDTQLLIQSNGELKTKVMDIFDRTFMITYALHIIAILVAILSIMNALFALVLESQRDFGLLKYLGASQKQIEKIVLIQAGLLGFLGNITGLTVGFLLSFLLIYVINKQSFGWTIQFHIPWLFLIESFALVLITALLSGIIPAKLASKTKAPEVIRNA